jgi:urea transport system substrate-binding protein
MEDLKIQESESTAVDATSGASINRRHVLATGAAALVGTVTGFPAIAQAKDKVKIGFHSALTGLVTILGETQVNCFKLAVEEVNAAGGAGGREIEYLIEDNQTSTRGAIDKTRKFIGSDKVDVIIGMITSLERAAALSVSVPAKKLVIYPTYYEGGECQRYLACTGQVPNQSIDPFVPWIMQNVGKTVYILGSDYVWPRKTAEAVTATLEKLGGKVIKSEFFPFGTQDFGPALDRIRAAKPDVVWELFAGNDAVSFIKQYASYKPGSQLLTNGLDELFTTAIDGSSVENIIVNQSYFSALPSKTNVAFLERYAKRFGKGKYVNSIGEATYNAVWLYAKAVAAAGSTDTEKVIDAMAKVSLDAPQGAIRMDPSNNHMYSSSIIGKCGKDGLFDIVKNLGVVKPDVPNCNLQKA